MHFEVLQGDELLITGRHLKFQPGGLPPGWSLLFHPLTRPASYGMIRRWLASLPENSEASPLPSPSHARMESLGMTAAASQTHDSFLHDCRLLTDHPVPVSAFSVAVDARFGNPGQNLHGGYASMLLDETASATFRKVFGNAEAPPVQRMHVSLLGAINVKKPKSIETTASVESATKAHGARAHCTLRVPGKATPAVEADIWW